MPQSIVALGVKRIGIEVGKISSQKEKLKYYGRIWSEMMDYQARKEHP